MNSFLEKLASLGTDESSPSDHLKLLGKRAAGMYLNKEADSLTGAVESVAREEGDLSNDQVRRISETANQSTWDTLFVQGKRSDASFEPADSEAVIGEMSVKPSEITIPGENDLDYYNDVPNQSVPDDMALEDAFGVKRDAPEYEYLNPVAGEQAAVEKIASARDLACFGVDQLTVDLAMKGEELYQMVKQAHIRDGFGILQISQAVGTAMEDHSYAAEVMKQIANRLQSEGVKFNQGVELEKIAYPLVVNTEHPLLTTAAILEKLAKCHYSANKEHEALRGEHQKAMKMLKDKARGL